MSRKGPIVLRTEATDARYREERAAHAEGYDPFEGRLQEPLLREFRFWAVIENSFPYDAVADVHHLLIPKRQFALAGDMNSEERAEFETIKERVRSEYDAIVENFPSIQSVPVRLHFHLVIWKRR